MQFVVPQFIERKPKIVGSLTFKQFVFVGVAGAFCIFIYFLLPWKNFSIVISIFLMGGGAALAFIKIGKDPLPVVIKNFFFYSLGPKVYLWKKKFPSSQVFEKPKIMKAEKEEEESTNIRIAGESRLKQLSTHIDTKLR